VVPVVDLSRRGRELGPEFAATVTRVLASGIRLLGEETAAFEHEFGEWLVAAQTNGGPTLAVEGSALDVVAVSSGASALQLALAGLGVGPGDEVILPAFTAVPTAAAVCALGAIPVLVDVEAETACLDPSLVAAARTRRTKAVIVVHLYGRPAALPSTDLPIIEDAAQAHGAIADHARSAAVAYSFYPTKNLGGIGDGGAVVTTDAGLGERVRRLRAHGMTELYVHEDISQNFRMSEIEAAWLRLSLVRLTRDNARRRTVAAAYRSSAPELRWQSDDPAHVYHLCVMRSSRRQIVRDTLAEAGVATAVHYPLAVVAQPAYRQFTTTPCPLARAWADECISVPCFPELSDGEIEHVAAALAGLPR
jgi:dTDP-3-amino-2,3,6-trideoxy-4-keto-D-glucose/dTDP-3-amino-3,4,6-trideoxy-alpha-D-glucose/dTDP-2,6-dideoxy-D-kanosamine transaminase